MMTDSSTNRRRVVVTGIGAVTNIGLDAPSIWDAMLSGRSGVSPIRGKDFNAHEGWSVTIAGQAHDFDPTTRLAPREAKKIDRFSQLGLCAAIESVEAAGLDFSSEDPKRCGAIIGSGVGGIQTIEAGVHVLRDSGPRRMSPFTVPRLMVNGVAGHVSIRFGLEGPTSAHATACASSGHSIADAMHIIQRGEADVMLAGGAEAAVSPICLAAFMTMRALSARNEEPEKASRPFDRDRDGFVLSEGAAVLTLESEEHARARGAEILCEIKGAGLSSDAHHITAPDAGGKGAASAMRNALRSAALSPSDVDYVNAHGTSTPLGDAAEVAAVVNVFGDHALKSRGGPLLMSSTKSMHGHCLGASGGVESVACINAIRHRTAPPTINCDNPDDDFDVDFVAGDARDAPIRNVLNNTFGFGGHNVSLVMGAFEG